MSFCAHYEQYGADALAWPGQGKNLKSFFFLSTLFSFFSAPKPPDPRNLAPRAFEPYHDLCMVCGCITFWTIVLDTFHTWLFSPCSLVAGLIFQSRCGTSDGRLLHLRLLNQQYIQDNFAAVTHRINSPKPRLRHSDVESTTPQSISVPHQPSPTTPSSSSSPAATATGITCGTTFIISPNTNCTWTTVPSGVRTKSTRNTIHSRWDAATNEDDLWKQPGRCGGKVSRDSTSSSSTHSRTGTFQPPSPHIFTSYPTTFPSFRAIPLHPSSFSITRDWQAAFVNSSQSSTTQDIIPSPSTILTGLLTSTWSWPISWSTRPWQICPTEVGIPSPSG